MSTVDHLLAMASECRDLATLAKTEEVREHLLEASDQIERLAEYQRRSSSTAPPATSRDGLVWGDRVWEPKGHSQ